MPARDQAERLGTIGKLLIAEGLLVEVRILDAKSAYGQERLLVSPVSGSGEAWVKADRVTA